MEELTNIVSGFLFMSGIILLITALVSYFFPPKKINALYGYRTNRSMQSPEHWAFAQKYATKQMFVVSIALILGGVIDYLFNLGFKTGILGIVALILAIVYIFFTTEKALKHKFPNP